MKPKTNPNPNEPKKNSRRESVGPKLPGSLTGPSGGTENSVAAQTLDLIT